MAYFQIATYSIGDYTYSLYEEANAQPALVSMRVLNHVRRRGIQSYKSKNVHYPVDLIVSFKDADGVLYDRISLAGKKSFVLELEENGSLLFKGFFLPSFSPRSRSIKDVRLELRFYDGLKLLTESYQSFVDDSLSALPEYIDWRTWFRYVLDRLGYSLPIRFSLDIEEEGVSAGLYTLRNYFKKTMTLEILPNATIYAVMVEVLRVFKAFIHLEDGIWYIQQYSNRDSTAFEEVTGLSAAAIVQTVDKTIPKYTVPATELVYPGIKNYTRNPVYNSQAYTLANNEFTVWNDADTLATNWDLQVGAISNYQNNGINAVEFAADPGHINQVIERPINLYSKFTLDYDFEFRATQVAGNYQVSFLKIILHNRNTAISGGHTTFWVDENGAFQTVDTSVNYSYNMTTGQGWELKRVLGQIEFVTPEGFVGFIEVQCHANGTNVYDFDGWHTRFYKVELGLDRGYEGTDPLPEEVVTVTQGLNIKGADESEEVIISASKVFKYQSDFGYYDGVDVQEGHSYVSSNHVAPASFDTIVLENYLARVDDTQQYNKIMVKKSSAPKMFQLINITAINAVHKFVPLYIEDRADTGAIKLHLIRYSD